MYLAPMRFLAVSALAFLVLIAPVPMAQQPPKPPSPQPPEKNPEPPPKALVHAEGCVLAGAEARCLLLRDLKTGHLFNLLFKADRPPIGMGIEFSGVLHPGPSACMHGAPVEVTTWARKASIKCTPGQAGKRGQTVHR